jgi:Flp pilus assembly protein TadD
MRNGDKKSPETGFRRTPRVDREEQGDLLAEAVTGFLSPDNDGEITCPDVGEENSAEERDPVARIEPAEGVESASEPHPDPQAGLIPASPWERKMAWAKEQAAEGRLGDARGLYRELVEEDPTNVRALNNLGILLDEMGDPEGAVAQLRAAKRIDPHNQEVLGNLSAALGAMGRYADAEEELRLAVRLDPSNLEIRANLGLLLFRRGLYEQAAAELAVVCAGRPDDGLPLFYRGEALNRLGRVEEAIKALERVTELIPGNPRAYYTLGVLFDKKNAPDRAAAMYRKARELADS